MVLGSLRSTRKHEGVVTTHISVVADTLHTARAVFRLEIPDCETALYLPLCIHLPRHIASSGPASVKRLTFRSRSLEVVGSSYFRAVSTFDCIKNALESFRLQSVKGRRH